jgi:ABC-type multidrug transport system permease subunit
MNDELKHSAKPRQYSPLGQLVLARLREFFRQPEVVFWVYGFPLLMVLALGIAFRNRPVEQIRVDVDATSPHAESATAALSKVAKFKVQTCDADADCRLRLRTGKTELVVVAHAGPHYRYVYDPTRPESLLARNAVDDALQRAAGRKDIVAASDQELNEPGGRYIDFLVPGLVGMGLMGGGLWGVGFVIVDMRIRQLLKRFIATPMKKYHFLGGIMISRFMFMIPEILVLLLFAWLVFDVRIQGSVLAVMFFVFLGAFTFSGIGLLVACRAKTLETVSGLMNMVMLPMWILSGIFFSSDRFPEVTQPFIKALPLTPLINALRAVILEGHTIPQLWTETGILALWGGITFSLALRWFRWV